MYQDGSPNAMRKVQEQPVFVECTSRINKRIASCHEAALRVENVIDRLLNPSPQPVSNGAVAQAPQTVEGALNQIDGNAEALAVRLHDLANKLERAA